MAKKLRITLSLPVAFLFVGLLATPAFATDPTTNELIPVEKSFYLTLDSYFPNEALTACAAGFHFASIWEIWYFSNFSYNTDLGITLADSGHGPPAHLWGWVRSGLPHSPVKNCKTWNSTAKRDSGTLAQIVFEHLFSGDELWKVTVQQCNEDYPVWCVSDAVY